MVPVNLLLHPEEVRFVLDDAEVRMLVFHEVTDRAVASIRGALRHTREFVSIGRTTVDGAEPYEALSAHPADPMLV